MSSISFFSGINAISLGGSGLGFYGSSFGASVAVNDYQDKTFITDGNGTLQGPEAWNTKFINANSGSLAGGAAQSLRSIPNYQGGINVRFQNPSSAVQTQNAKLRIYDRASINNAAVGVTTKVAELIHPWTTQLPSGSGSTAWLTPAGSSVIVSMSNNPGISGLFGGNHTIHDWYAVVSASPNSIGSKTQYGLYFSVEFL